MAETAETYGVEVPTLTAETQAAMRELLPSYLTVSNPVDNGGTFLLTAPEADRRRLLSLLAQDPQVDLVVVGLTGAVGDMTDNLAADIRALADVLPVPLIATWNSYKTDEQGFHDLVASGVPLFRSFHGCFNALAAWKAYRERIGAYRVREWPPAPADDPFAAVPAGTLDAQTSRALLDAFGVAQPGQHVATTPEAAAAAADTFGYPVVLKIASADIAHKSDLGLVRVGVADRDDVRAVARELLDIAAKRAPEARLDGVLVQQQIGDGVEMIVGIVTDPVLGPAITVGTGGVFAEVLRDVATRPLPIDRSDAREMVASLRGSALLAGARGRPPCDVEALLDVIEATARLASAAGGRIAELDLNPVVVTPDGALAVDSLIVTAADRSGVAEAGAGSSSPPR
jgi:acyl-CoA synthetase (NDP forming)